MVTITNSSVTCPKCNVEVPREDIQFTRSFACPHCQAQICVPFYYRLALVAIGWIVSATLLYLLGITNVVLLLLTTLPLLFIIIWLLSIVAGAALPLKLQV